MGTRDVAVIVAGHRRVNSAGQCYLNPSRLLILEILDTRTHLGKVSIYGMNAFIEKVARRKTSDVSRARLLLIACGVGPLFGTIAAIVREDLALISHISIITLLSSCIIVLGVKRPRYAYLYGPFAMAISLGARAAGFYPGLWEVWVIWIASVVICCVMNLIDK